RPDDPGLHHGRAGARDVGRDDPLGRPASARQGLLPRPYQGVEPVRRAEHHGQALLATDPAAADPGRDGAGAVPAEPGLVRCPTVARHTRVLRSGLLLLLVGPAATQTPVRISPDA